MALPLLAIAVLFVIRDNSPLEPEGERVYVEEQSNFSIMQNRLVGHVPVVLQYPLNMPGTEGMFMPDREKLNEEAFGFFGFQALGRFYFLPEACVRNKKNYRMRFGLAPRDNYTEAIANHIAEWSCKGCKQGSKWRDIFGVYNVGLRPLYFDSQDDLLNYYKENAGTLTGDKEH